MPGFEPDRARIALSTQGQWAKNGKYEYCYYFGNSDFMPSEGNFDLKTSYDGRIAGVYQLSTWTYVA